MIAMKKIAIYKIAYLLFGITAVALTGCKDTAYDVTGDTVNRVYINTHTSTTNTYSFSVVHTPVASTGTITASFPVRCTQEAKTDLQVTLSIDTNLVSTYNKANSTRYKAIPNELTTLTNNVLTIPQGQTISKDSITITVPSDKLSQLTDSSYLIPVKISTVNVSEKDAAGSSNYNTVYLKISTSKTNIKSGAGSSDMVGTIVSTRTGWTITSDASTMSGSGSNVFDSSTSTAYYNTSSSISTLTFTVDLATTYTTISGLRIYTRYANYGYYSSTVGVYTSTDNSTWTSQGTVNLSATYNYNYICFYSTVSARYIKLVMSGWTYYYYKGLTDFNIYTN
jgi:hypothetical protein